MSEDLALEMASHAPRRRAVNYLLEPALQLKLPLYLLLVTLAFLAIQGLNSWLAYAHFYEPLMRETGYADSLGSIVQAQTVDFLIASSVIGIGYVLVVVGVSVAYAHRMVGPVRAFRRHVQSLTRGDYASRVNLRQRDAFTEFAADLNELAKRLDRDRQGGPTAG